jgi:esterase/lipase
MKYPGILFWLLLSPVIIAGDVEREADFAEALQQNLKMGSVVWLEAEQQRFLALYTETVEAENQGTVILLHDRDGYPDKKTVVHALRTILPQHRWATLALQMPLREAGALESEYYPLFDEAKARISAAVEYLRASGIENIVIVGYGIGGMMGLFSVAESASLASGLITIGLPVPDSEDSKVQIENFIAKLTIPMLDIYAERDLPAVGKTSRKRKLAGRANPAYRQDKINGVDRLFQHDGELIAKRVYSWLRGVFQSTDGKRLVN